MAPQTKAEDIQEMAAMKTVFTKMQALVQTKHKLFFLSTANSLFIFTRHFHGI